MLEINVDQAFKAVCRGMGACGYGCVGMDVHEYWCVGMAMGAVSYTHLTLPTNHRV